MFNPIRINSSRLAADVAIQKNIFGSDMTTLIFPNEKVNIMKIVNSLEDAGLLIKGVSYIGASLIQNLLTVKSYLSR